MGISVQKLLTLRGRSAGYKARLADVERVGRTQTEARDNLVAAVEGMISGSFEPSLLSYGPNVAVVWRDMYGWSYRIGPAHEIDTRSTSKVSLSTYDRSEAILAARRTLVQMAYPKLAGLAFLCSARDWHGVLDQAHWLGFQRAYERARQSGADDVEAHRIACEAANDPALIGDEERQFVERARVALGR